MRKLIVTCTAATAVVAVALALGLVCLAAPVPASSPKPGPLTGTWSCTSHGGQNGDMNFTLDLQQTGEDVTGDVSSPIGDADLSSGTFKNNELTLTIGGEDDQYTLTATFNDGKLTGKWSTSSSGDKGTWEGKKASTGNPSGAQ